MVMGVGSLGYVVAETRDLGAWRRFGTGVLGLMEASAPASGMLAFRIDKRPFRLLIVEGAREGFLTAGLEFVSPGDYQAALAALRAAGVAVEEATPTEAKARHAHGLARCSDPDGNRLELYFGHVLDYVPFASPAGVSGFVTGSMGLGHVVFPTTKLEASRSFFVDLLGFGDSDQTRVFLSPDPADPGLGLYFLHADNPRHHTVALAEFPQPSGLIHMMLEVKTLDDVGRALDRAMKSGAHISATLGRHANDKMVSFYVRSPSGFDIEYGCEGWQVDWADFTPTTSLIDSIWGHQWDFGAPPA
jgi:3,4-dihydroxy-9,10-secoandrosta-1,3,5(10)-triene-9,17-dione 4,5-dioxygenase